MRKGAWRAAAIATFVLLAAIPAACDPCAGIAYCHVYPEASYGAQAIEHQSGKAVAGVSVMFARESGLEMLVDTLRAVSAADGFFVLRGQAYGTGDAIGTLTVTPPAPWPPYAVPNFHITAKTVWGGGHFAGRLLVNPYVMFLGEVFDRRTASRVPGASLTVQSVAGPFTEPILFQGVTDELGRFLILPKFAGFGQLDFQITLNVPNDPETYNIPYRVTPNILDRPPYALLVQFPRVLRYIVETSRRGTGQFVPGVTWEFARTGGIAVTPTNLTGVPSENGRFAIMPRPTTDGALIGALTIRAPGFPPETVTLSLPTSYTDSVFFLGIKGYGAQAYMLAQLIDRATGLPPTQKMDGRVLRVSGLSLVYPPGTNPAADSGLRRVTKSGQLPYVVATQDSGEVFFNLELRPPGFRREVYNGVRVRAKYSEVADTVGPFRIGAGFPWYGELRDLDTNAPISGAQVTYLRVAGGAITPSSVSVVSGVDGRFRLAPIPAGETTTTGTLSLQFNSTQYRDSTETSVQLQPTYDDSLRLLKVYRFKKQGP